MSGIPPPGVLPLDLAGARKGLFATFWYDFFRALSGVQGKWTPAITFATPGNFAVTYAADGQQGWFIKQNRLVTLHFAVVTATFTHTTAAGALRMTGTPFVPNGINGTGRFFRGNLALWQGITKAGFTQMAAVADTANYLTFGASGSGVALADVNAADMPTGGAVQLRGYITYETTE